MKTKILGMKMSVRCFYYGSNGFHDWEFYCPEHGEKLTTPDWESAYEAALGHACMKHPSKKGWFKREFTRARERSAQLPAWARPS